MAKRRRSKPRPIGSVVGQVLEDLGLDAAQQAFRIGELWEDVVGVKPVGITDDFFDIGGHSLLAVQLFARIRSDLRVDLPLATLFRAPTVEQLAVTISAGTGARSAASLVPISYSASPPLLLGERRL